MFGQKKSITNRERTDSSGRMKMFIGGKKLGRYKSSSHFTSKGTKEKTERKVGEKSYGDRINGKCLNLQGEKASTTTNGEESIMRKPVPSKSSQKYSLDMATLMSDLSTFVYLGQSWWASNKEGMGVADDPEKFSLNCKFLCGQLLVELGPEAQKAIEESRLWSLSPVPRAFDSNFGGNVKKKKRNTGTIRSGMIVENSTDTQAIVLLNTPRRYVVLTIRGTSSHRDIRTDVQLLLVKSPVGTGRVHRGMRNVYLKIADPMISLLNQIFDQTDESGEQLYDRLYITGHSLGGGIATIAAVGIYNRCPKIRKISVYTFGSPRIGNKTFAKDYEQKIPDTWRHVNDQDIITSTGPRLFGYKHVNNKVFMNDFDFEVNPSEGVIKVDPGTNPFSDHIIGHYTRLLGQYQAVMRIPPNHLVTIYDAWLTCVDNPRVVQVLSEEDPEAKHLSWLINFESKRIRVLEFDLINQHLVDHLGFDPYITSLIEVHTRFLARSRNLINWSFFVAAVHDLFYRPNRAVTISHAELRALLEKYDWDGNGFLSFLEFKAVHKDLFGVEIDDDDLKVEFECLDLNTDHQISFSEFIVWKSLAKSQLSPEDQEKLARNIKRLNSRTNARFIAFNDIELAKTMSEPCDPINRSRWTLHKSMTVAPADIEQLREKVLEQWD